MNDWVVESPSFEEELMNNRIVYLNQKGIDEVVELINNKDKEIERLNNIINKAIEYITRNCYKVCDKQLYGIPIMSIKLDNADNLLDILKGVDTE